MSCGWSGLPSAGEATSGRLANAPTWISAGAAVRSSGLAVLAACLLAAGCVQPRRSNIVPGQGDERVRLGDTRAEVLRALGSPATRTQDRDRECFTWTHPRGLQACLDRSSGRVYRITFGVGHRGRLPGGIGIGMPLAQVLERSGGALKTVKVPAEEEGEHGTDRVLYELTARKGPSTFRLIDACRGVVHVFDARRRLDRIEIRRPERLCSCIPRGEPALDQDPRRASGIRPDQGNQVIRIGDPVTQVLATYGQPEQRDDYGDVERLVYHRRFQVDFLVHRKTGRVIEFRFAPGYGGRLDSGIGLCSPMEEVLKRSGGATRTVRAPREESQAHGSNRVLYEVTYGGRLGAYLFRDQCRGILYWFDAVDRRAIQIVVHQGATGRACSCIPGGAPAPDQDPRRASAIRPGIGNQVIRIGDPVTRVLATYGQPEQRDGSGNVERLVYHRRFQVDFLVHRKTGRVIEFRFAPGYGGRLDSGVGLCSPMEEVLKRSGGATRTVRAPREQSWAHGSDRVLYEVTYSGRLGAYLFRDVCRGILYWFDPVDRRASQIVVYDGSTADPSCPAR